MRFTSDAFRLLAHRPDLEGPLRPALARATRAPAALQRDDGSVGGSVLLPITLAETGDYPKALSTAKAWLRAALERGGPAGDGFLYDWFEFGGGSRVFFDCRERGRITEALAKAALGSPRARRASSRV